MDAPGNVTRLEGHLHTEWPSARPELQRHLNEHPEIVREAVRAALRACLPTLILWLALINVAAASLTVLVVVKIQNDHLARLNLSTVVLSEEARINAIAAILHQIPHGPGNRHMDGDLEGRPTVTALQARLLDDVPEISGRERDIACERVEGACQPPAKRSP